MPKSRLSALMPLMFVLPLAAIAEVAKSDLKVTPALAREGYVTLSWKKMVSSADEPRDHVVLQIARDPSFSPLHASYPLQQQQQMHLSGFADGEYHARLLDANSKPLSLPAQFEVRHRSLNQAFALFALGAVLFAILLVLLVRFNRDPS